MVEVWGREDLTCPVSRQRLRALVRYAYAHPWRGDMSVLDRRHFLETTAITEPGRPTMVLFTLDYGYHSSGWFANSDYEWCLHLSVSHPRPDRLRLYPAPAEAGTGAYLGIDVETPSDEEVRAWGRVFFKEHAPKAWFEPAVGPGDPYRSPNVVHLRLYLDKQQRPIIPRGEVYTLLPWADGTSPKKITDGRAGADIR